MFGSNYFGQPYFGQGYASEGILFDNASNSGYEAALSTYNWAHITGLSSMGLVVNVSIFATGTVSSITYGGVNLAFVRADSIGVYRNEIWILPNPAYGSNTLTVNLSTSLTSIASAASYGNVNPDMVEASAGATGSGVSTPSVTLTTVNNYAWVVDGLSTSDTTMTPAGGQTRRDNNTGALGTGAMGDIGPVTPVGSQATSWSAVTITDSWAIGAIALSPANETFITSIAQVGATLTFTGGTQSVVSQTSATVTQNAASITATGGTQYTGVAITQSGATLTVTGGTQNIASVRIAAVNQSAATITATGGTQSVSAGGSVSVSQVAATVTASGGTQSVAAINDVSVSQAHATITATGGTQSVVALVEVSASVTQTHAILTVTGGTQSLSVQVDAVIAQRAATITAIGGTQAVVAKIIRTSTWTPEVINPASWSSIGDPNPDIWSVNPQTEAVPSSWTEV